MSTREEIAQMLEDVEERESRLDDWERGFIESIGEQFAESGTLSGPQDERLEQIWDRVTS